MRGDLLRLAMLWQYGGLAPDWNTAPLDGLLPLIEGCSLVLTHNDWAGVSLELVAATPQHPWVGAALQQACRQVLEGQGYSRWDVSGDCLLSGVFARWLAPSLAQGQWPEGLRLLPLPALRRHLGLWRGLPRPANLPPEQPLTTLFNHSQRRRAGCWLAARQG